MSGAGQGRSCRSCAHFRNDPKYLEDAIPGWKTLGSAYGSTRAEDGICELRGIYLSASQCCERYEARQVSDSGEAPRDTPRN